MSKDNFLRIINNSNNNNNNNNNRNRKTIFKSKKVLYKPTRNSLFKLKREKN